MDSDEVPEERCGFVLEPGDLPEHAQEATVSRFRRTAAQDYDPESDEWYEESDAVCCWRSEWEGATDGRCIWHAHTDDKPADALVAARADEPERLDGAYVPAVELGDAIDFEECGLQAATFDGTGLQQAVFAGVDGRGIQFPDADLREAQFPDIDLPRAQFPDADLWGAQFPDAYLFNAEFPNASLRDSQFPDAVLWEAQFPDANLREAEFPNADLLETQFPNAFLRFAQFPNADLEAAQFPNADLQWAQFPDAILYSAYFPNTDLSAADLSDTDAAHATFTGARLEAARLTNADLGEADLTDARLHEAHLLNVRINARTAVDSVAPEEADADWFAAADLSLPDRLRWWLAWWRADGDARDAHRDQLDRAHTVYRTIQRLYRENSMPEAIDEYHVRAKDVRRKQAIIDRNLPRWLYLASQRWVMRYGERPRRVVYTSLAVIAGAAVVYPLVGGLTRPPQPAGATRVAYDLLPTVPVPVPSWLEPLLTSLYFSVVTFTTLGYGDLQPATGAAQAVATVESFVGALLLALLVYVLGRRATR